MAPHLPIRPKLTTVCEHDQGGPIHCDPWDLGGTQGSGDKLTCSFEQAWAEDVLLAWVGRGPGTPGDQGTVGAGRSRVQLGEATAFLLRDSCTCPDSPVCLPYQPPCICGWEVGWVGEYSCPGPCTLPA